MKIIILILCILASVQSAYAREWREIIIPGAFCGDGSPYKVFLDKRSHKRMLIEFMGGGACWSDDTCRGYNLRTWIYNIPKVPQFSVLMSDIEGSPWSKHSVLYFPYCTGDVHAGNHVATYEGKKI